MSRGWRWLIAVLGPLALFALVWWAWLALRLPPDDPGGRLAAALATAGAVAVSVGALLAWWAARDTDLPQATAPPGTGSLPTQSTAVTASGERSVAIGGDNSGSISTGDGAPKAPQP